MAGRIRSIKPEVLEDETASALSDAAWRLWVSLWVLADDHGNARMGPRYLGAQVWQDTSRDTQPHIDELLRAGLVQGYGVNGEHYGHIKGWAKHQRVDNAGRPRVPQPHEDDGSWIQALSVRSAAGRGQSPRVAAVRRLTSDLRPPTTDPDQVPAAGPLVLVQDTGPSPSPSDRLMAVHAHYVALRKKYRPGARAPKIKPAEQKRAKQLLDAGYTHEDLMAACEGLFLSPHHLGQNDRSTDYLEFFHALGEKVVDGFIAAADAQRKVAASALPPKPKLPPGPPAPAPDGIRERFEAFAQGQRSALLAPDPDPVTSVTPKAST